MKNFKIKSGLMSLLTILAISIVFISCEQESIVPSIEETFTTELRSGQTIWQQLR